MAALGLHSSQAESLEGDLQARHCAVVNAAPTEEPSADAWLEHSGEVMQVSPPAASVT